MKKWLSVFLSVLLILSLIPASVSANETGEVSITDVSAIESADRATAEVTFSLVGSALEPTLYVALYTKQNQMIDIEAATEQNAGYAATVTLPADKDGIYGKVFVWGNEANPYSDFEPFTVSTLISNSCSLSGASYGSLIICESVGEGEVSLSDVTISGDLIIRGGGSNSIKLDGCSVLGKVIMEKETGNAPRLELTKTPIEKIEVKNEAIIETTDAVSAISEVLAYADIEIKGDNTSVERVEIPPTAAENISVTVADAIEVEVEVNSTNGVAITGELVEVSTALATTPENVTVGGEAAEHIHQWTPWTEVAGGGHTRSCLTAEHPQTEEHTWDEGVITQKPTETAEGVKTYTCPRCSATKTESVPVISAVKITLVQEGDSIKATWTGTAKERYAYCWVDQDGVRASLYYWTDEYSQTSYELSYSIPRLEVDSSSYDFVLYEITDNKVGSEIARLENAVAVTIADVATDYEIAFNVPSEGMHTVTFNEMPSGLCYIDAWYRDNAIRSTGYEDITSSVTKNFALQDGDIYDLRLLTTYTLEGQTIKAVMTPPSKTTYTAPAESLLSFRKWNTDIMFDGYDDVADTKSLEVDGVKVVSSKQETMSEFLFEYDQTKGNITDADFVVELDGVEKERISKNVDVTLSNTDVAFLVNADGTLSFDATTHGSFAYKTTKGGAGRIAFNNGTLVDGWTLPTLADGETIDIMHIDCVYEELSKTIVATISKHTSKTYVASSDAVYTFIEQDGLKISWNEATLADGESYYLLMGKPDSNFITTTNRFPMGAFLAGEDIVSGKIALEVNSGTSWTQNSSLYASKEIANVTVSGAAPEFSIEKDSAGNYSFVSDASGGAWVYKTYNADGNQMYIGNAVGGKIDTYANFASGHKVDARYITWQLNDDKTYAEITVSEIGSFTYSEQAEEVTPNIWLTMDGNYLSLVWNDDEGLGTGEWYYILEDGVDITSEEITETELTWLLPGISESTTKSYEIQKGNWSNRPTLYTLENALKITVTDETPEISLVPQEDGTYKFISNSNEGYFYSVKTPDGDRLATDYTLDGTLLCAIYEGCTVEVQTGTITLADDAQSADITMSQVVTITNPELCTSLDEVIEVSNEIALVDAVNRGATAKLTTDITAPSMIKLKTGAPAKIDLNGYKIIAPSMRVYYGKELEIDGSKEGSQITSEAGNNTLYSSLYAKLTLNGGSYNKLNIFDARSFVARNITSTYSANSVMANFYGCDELSVENSSFTNTSASRSSSIMQISDSGNVSLTDVFLSGEGNGYGADIYRCSNVGISGGEYAGKSLAGIRFLGGVAYVKGATVKSDSAAIALQSGAEVEISGGNFETSSYSSIILSSGSTANKMTITGGNFSNTSANSTKYIVKTNSNDEVIIEGGTFNLDPTEYVDTTTHTVTQSSDGTYSVSPKN